MTRNDLNWHATTVSVQKLDQSMTRCLTDVDFMARALRLAQRGRYSTHPNPRVGCVLTKNLTVVGEGFHQLAGNPHAEIEALHDAGTNAAGATAYVTLEPCAHRGRTGACTDALIEAGVERVVSAMIDPNPEVRGKGISRLQEAGIMVECPLLESSARDLNPGFIKRFEVGMPYVRCKIATSVDGRTALGNGKSKWITSAAARQDVQRLRAESSAIVTGIETVLTDDPSMNVRLDELRLSESHSKPGKQPIRVILDSKLRIPLNAKILQDPQSVLVVSCEGDAAKKEKLQANGVEVIDGLSGAEGRVDLVALLKLLAARDYHECLFECGATLAGNLVTRGLVDELVFYMAGKLMGDLGRPMLKLPEFFDMAQVIDLEFTEISQVGDDLRIRAKPRVRHLEP